MIVREVIGNLAVLQNIAYGITGHTSVPLHQLVKIP
jgi:hypothetical protein